MASRSPVEADVLSLSVFSDEAETVSVSVGAAEDDEALPLHPVKSPEKSISVKE